MPEEDRKEEMNGMVPVLVLWDGHKVYDVGSLRYDCRISTAST